jgi:transcriptional antiterminator RfaH
MSRDRWYVVQTQPLGEARALANLSRQDFEAYLPRYKRERRHARRVDTVVRPLFPRYLFVRLDLGRDRWRSVSSTYGVSQMIMSGEMPAPLPDGLVEELRGREIDDGFIKLSLPPGLEVGSRIRLTEGLFVDHVGVIERVADEHRIAILLQLLGREVRVFVPPYSVAAA